ncbi:MAG: hypothetical protein WBO69_16115 [Thermoanaerobaculia bacterium]
MTDFRWLGLAVLVLALVGPARPAEAEVRIYSMQSRTAFLAGTLDGIGVDSLGTLRLADQVERLTEVNEPFLLSAASHPDGWVVGTGNGGRVLLIDRQGETTVLFEAEEPEIFAVWVAEDGAVFAGSSPNGKVYRLGEDDATVFFDPEQTYIWDLERGAGGSLLVATGTDGKLFKVEADGQAEVLFDSQDTHLRTLKALPNGQVLMGTAGEGLILRLDPDGTVRTLYDAAQPEVVAFAADPDGDCYAAVLASEASLVSLHQPAEEPSEEDESSSEEGNDGGEVTVQITVSAESRGESEMVGTRPSGFQGPRSEILRISSEGLVQSLTAFEEETVYSIAWQRGRLWVGTGLEGKVFSLSDGKPVLEKDVDERQVVVLLEDDPGPAFATTNAAALYRISGRTERRGVYTSPTLDAQQFATFGNLRWQGKVPQGSQVRFSFRTGMSSDPDRTWSDWTLWQVGMEVSLAQLPAGRYFQWRAELEADGGTSPSLSEIQISYKQTNLPPRIDSLTVMEPGQVLVPANFNPAQQVYEPVHPDRQGIFTVLEAETPSENRRLKTLWKKGYRTLRWKSEDPNEDDLFFDLEFRRADWNESWLPMAKDLRDSHHSFDATALPDGRYRFRLSVRDRIRSEESGVQRSEEISEPVLVDHSVPELVGVQRQAESLEVQVEDRWSPLRRAEFSLDAGEWLPARPVDGLLDGQNERLLVDIPASGKLILLRLMDAAFNVVTFDLSQDGP